MNTVYYIGGSPCCGKSLIAELIEKKYNLTYFKLDDKLEEYMKKAQKDGKEFSTRHFTYTSDDIWLRSPFEQNKEAFAIYKEIFEYALTEINTLLKDSSIITEGAGYLPELIRHLDNNQYKYICMVPTKDFQYEKYAQRPWVPYILDGCSDKQLAFQNWMERDALFALDVSKSASNLGYPVIIVDGKASVEENLTMIEMLFGFGDNSTDYINN